MAKPPNFSGTSHEDMKRLLAGADAQRDAIEGWKMLGSIALIVFLLLIVFFGALSMFMRLF